MSSWAIDPRLLAVVILLLGALGAAVDYCLERRAQQRQRGAFQVCRRPYGNVLVPAGMTTTDHENDDTA